ncbi:acyl-CoA thioesterase [Candidatus Sumerlaeota bacterium]|nr:acyl-CoA thioesterase [Candidatus Sumerlaeota bacterium]
MDKPKFHFSHPLRVRWSEVDRQGVVFNGHYLNYFDVAMTEYLRGVGFPYPQGLIEHGTDLYLRKASVECLGAVGYDDLLDIRARVARIGNTSLTFEFEICRAGEQAPLAAGQNVYVNVDLAGRKPAPLPPALAAAIKTRENAPPDRE